jgi:hypothetical protein
VPPQRGAAEEIPRCFLTQPPKRPVRRDPLQFDRLHNVTPLTKTSAGRNDNGEEIDINLKRLFKARCQDLVLLTSDCDATVLSADVLELLSSALTTVLYLFQPGPPEGELVCGVMLGGIEVSSRCFDVVRLWEIEAETALARGKLGTLPSFVGKPDNGLTRRRAGIG